MEQLLVNLHISLSIGNQEVTLISSQQIEKRTSIDRTDQHEQGVCCSWARGLCFSRGAGEPDADGAGQVGFTALQGFGHVFTHVTGSRLGSWMTTFCQMTFCQTTFCQTTFCQTFDPTCDVLTSVLTPHTHEQFVWHGWGGVTDVIPRRWNVAESIAAWGWRCRGAPLVPLPQRLWEWIGSFVIAAVHGSDITARFCLPTQKRGDISSIHIYCTERPQRDVSPRADRQTEQHSSLRRLKSIDGGDGEAAAARHRRMLECSDTFRGKMTLTHIIHSVDTSHYNGSVLFIDFQNLLAREYHRGCSSLEIRVLTKDHNLFYQRRHLNC